MVDLVKIRRKAKEKKEKEARESAAAAEAPPPSEVSESRKSSGGSRKTRSSSGDTPRQANAAPEVAPPSEPVAPEDAASASPAEPAAASPARGERRAREREKPSAAAVDRLEEFRRTAGLQREIESGPADESVDSSESQLELLVFHLAEEQYAVEISSILEITRPRSITRVPNAGASVVGIMSLRGTIVTILDVRRDLGHSRASASTDEQRIIVVERDEEVAGFLVDRVYRVIRIDASEVESHPVVSSNEQNRCVRGVFRHRDRITILLALEQLLERGTEGSN